jgi:hypothetical protein
MKKILLYIPLIALFLASCDPMKDIYQELDDAQVPYKESIEYTLTATDYSNASKAALANSATAMDSANAKLIASKLAFNEYFGAADYVGGILAKNFPVLNKSSVAKVTYNYNEGVPAYLSTYTAAPKYALADADYMSLGGVVGAVKYFVPSQNAASNLPVLIAAKYPAAVSGDLVYVSYKSSDIQPDNGPKNIIHFAENFDAYTTTKTVIGSNGDGWQNINAFGTKFWISQAYSGNYYAQFSAYSSSPKEDNVVYMITPEIDLTGSEQNKLSFDVNAGYFNASCLEVLISENFSGDVSTAIWTNLTSSFTLPTGPASGYGTFASAGSVDISAYKGKVVVAFRYTGSSVVETLATTTYQIDNVEVKGITYMKKKATTADYLVYNDIYQYASGKWSVSSAVVVDPADYTAMGFKYPNFSSTAPASNYIPNYLASLFPYALEGTKKAVVYDYYTTTTTRKADEYTLSAGTWAMTKPIVEMKDQFVHTGEKWIFDPTIKLEPSSGDYQLLVDYVYENLSRTYGSSYSNDEYYYGVNAYYKNFDLRLSNKTKYSIPGFDGLTEAEAIALTWVRVEEALNILLTLKYTEAQTDINDIPIYYWVTFLTYENNLSKNTYTGVYKCTKAGPNAEFERATDIEDQLVKSGELASTAVNWNR